MSSSQASAGAGGAAETSTAPSRAGLVLVSLILVAAVANLNLSVANVALPDIGEAFDSSQTTLNLIAVGYSLGLAASVLWLGALGDRYGRKLMIVLGMSLSVPASLLAGFAPSDTVLFVARVVGGISAGHGLPDDARPDHGALVGPRRGRRRSRSGRLSAVAIALLGPLISGALLEHFDWGSVFLVTLPLVAIALPMAIIFVPGARQRDDAIPSTTSAGSSRPSSSARSSSRSTSCRCRTSKRSPSGLLAVALAALVALLRPRSAGRRTRSTTSTSPRARPSGWRRAPGSSCSAR